MKLRALVSILVPSCVLCASAAEPDFRVSIAPAEQTIIAGSMPEFVIEVANISKRPILAMERIDKRPDLATASLDLHIQRGGKPVEVGVAICDPGAVDPKRDFFDMPAGATIMIKMSWFPELYDELPPGEYDAYFTFYPHAKVTKTDYESNRVKIRIIPKKEPNQAPLPTPASVTPVAGAPVAPDAGAAEL